MHGLLHPWSSDSWTGLPPHPLRRPPGKSWWSLVQVHRGSASSFPPWPPANQQTSKPDFSDTIPLVQDLSLPPLESSSPEKPRKALLPTTKLRKALLPTPRYLYWHLDEEKNTNFWVHVIFRPPAPQAEPRNALLEQNSLELMEMMRQWCINHLIMLRERWYCHIYCLTFLNFELSSAAHLVSTLQQLQQEFALYVLFIVTVCGFHIWRRYCYILGKGMEKPVMGVAVEEVTRVETKICQILWMEVQTPEYSAYLSISFATYKFSL